MQKIKDEGVVYYLGEMGRLSAMEAETGKELWVRELPQEYDAPATEYGYSESDGMIYMLSQRGTMTLIRATPEKYETAGSFSVPEGGKGMCWAHPVVCGGRLYIRHDDRLFVYGIKREGVKA